LQIQVITALADLPTWIHLSFDLWISTNHRALMGINAHWVTLECGVKHGVLGILRFCGRHTEDNQAETVCMVTQEYNIERNLGYFTLDNATNNNTVIRCMATKLWDNDITVDPVKRRLRSLCHILNLVVKAFLWGDDPETFEQEVDYDCNRGDEQAELDLLRKRVPLGKLHNIIVWIGRSPQRQDQFQ
jgi:hypothetical protein